MIRSMGSGAVDEVLQLLKEVGNGFPERSATERWQSMYGWG